MKTVPQVTALQAQAAANLFLRDCLPDRFTAEQAMFEPTQNVWRVPVVLAYPNLGVLGRVGEVLVSPVSEEIIAHTPFPQMKQEGQSLARQHSDEIQTAFL